MNRACTVCGLGWLFMHSPGQQLCVKTLFKQHAYAAYTDNRKKWWTAAGLESQMKTIQFAAYRKLKEWSKVPVIARKQNCEKASGGGGFLSFSPSCYGEKSPGNAPPKSPVLDHERPRGAGVERERKAHDFQFNIYLLSSFPDSAQAFESINNVGRSMNWVVSLLCAVLWNVRCHEIDDKKLFGNY